MPTNGMIAAISAGNLFKRTGHATVKMIGGVGTRTGPIGGTGHRPGAEAVAVAGAGAALVAAAEPRPRAEATATAANLLLTTSRPVFSVSLGS
jgi:hypothetical protein